MVNKKEEKASDIATNPFLSGINPNIVESNPDIVPGDGETTDFLGTISKISQLAIQKIQEESLPCLPSNYQLYFEKFLEKEEPSIKQKIRSVMNLQSDIQNRALVFEKAVGENLRAVRQVVNCMSVVYQNFLIAQNVVKQYSKDIEQADNKLTLKNVMDFFTRDMNKVADVTSKQLNQIKDLYNKTDENLKRISQNSVYDLTLDVYNKKYFLSSLQREQKLCVEFKHSSVLVYITLAQSLSRKFGQDSSVFMLLLKTMAKFLQKHIQISNCIAYLGEGIFGVLLKYADIAEAQNLCIMLYQAAQTTDVFVGDMNIQLDLTSSIVKISAERSAEQTMTACMSTLEIALEEKQHCKIYQQDDINATSADS